MSVLAYRFEKFFSNSWRGLITSKVGIAGPFDLQVVNCYGYISRNNPITNGDEALTGLNQGELQEALKKIEALQPLLNERLFS
jgi:hypothetical protein